MSQEKTVPKGQDALLFFNGVLEKFKEAVSKINNEMITQNYEIGGHKIQMQFAGPTLIPYFTPALDHLQIPEIESPNLTICLWDSASTKIEMLTPPWATQEFEHQGEIMEFNTERMCTLFQPGEDTLNLLDHERNLAILWRRDNQNIPYYTTSSPLRSIFHWWMSQNKRQFIHGAAIGRKDGGALIVGKGGSGKSTTALSCLNSNLVYVGDDYVLLGMDEGPYVFSLFSSAKLNCDQMEMFPQLKPFIFNTGPSEEDKTLILLNDHMPEKISKGFPLQAIFIPQITGKKETKLSKATATAALTALAPSTMFQLTRNRAQTFQILAELVRKIPAYYLECGTEIQKIPEVIEEFLEK